MKNNNKTKNKINSSAKLLSLAVAAIIGQSAISIDAHAIVNINSESRYATPLAESKNQDIAENAAQTAIQTARLYDVLHYLANHSSVNQEIRDYITANLPRSDVLQNGGTFTLFDGASSRIGASVSDEPVVRVGTGSQPKLNASGRGLDIENVPYMEISGKYANNRRYFAGGETSGEVSVGNVEKNQYRTITGVAAGRVNQNSTDAINGSQLYALKDIVQNIANNSGVNFYDGFLSETKNNNAFQILGDNNVSITVSEPKLISGPESEIPAYSLPEINVKINPELTVNKLTTGDAYISNVGINGGNMKITGVTNGDVTENSTDAVNGSQLLQYANQSKTTVKAGTGGIVVSEGVNEHNGKEYIISFNGQNTQPVQPQPTNTLESAVVSITGKNGIVTTKKVETSDSAPTKEHVTVELDQETRNNIQLGVDAHTKVMTEGIKFVGDNKSPTPAYKLGEIVPVLSKGSNISTSTSQLGVYIGLNERLTDISSLETKSGITITENGLYANGKKLSNIADATLDTDAVNLRQLKALKNEIVANQNQPAQPQNVNLGFSADNGVTINKQNDGVLEFTGGANQSTLTESNIGVNTTNGKINIQLSKNINLTDKGSVELGDISLNETGLTVGDNGVGVYRDGINAGLKTIKNVADGLIAQNSKDAINGGQLFDALQNVEVGNVVKYDDESRSQVTFNGDGGTKLTNVKAGDISQSSTDAINGSQLNEVKNAVVENAQNIANNKQEILNNKTAIEQNSNKISTNSKNIATNQTNIAKNTEEIKKGLNFSDSKGKTTNVQLGGNLNMLAQSDNIVVSVNDGAVNFDLAQDQNLNSSTYDKVSVSKGGINAGGHKIVNTAHGLIAENSLDAVNGHQLYELSKKIQSNVTNFEIAADYGENIQVTDNIVVGFKGDKNIQTQTNDNQVQIGLSSNIEVDSLKANNSISVGSTSITTKGVNSGGNRIINVADAVNVSDAVNLGQLNNLQNKMDSKIDRVEKNAEAGVAMALAVGTLGQAWQAGTNTVSLSGSTYGGKTGWAIGGSNLTDNGKWLIKYNISGASSTNKVGGAASVTYQY